MSDFRSGAISGTLDIASESVPLNRFFLPAAPETRDAITSPEAGAKVLGPHLFGMDREVCMAVYVDTKHRMLGIETISIGSVDHTFMVPRDIFRGALLSNASAIVLAHNHPSGNPEPSNDDEMVTRRIVRAGELMGVEVLDHLVFGSTSWTSLARRGII